MVFVVAEIGVNWDGNFKLAKEMMQNAKKAGCNAVKFQAYLEETVKSHPEYLRLVKATISTKRRDDQQTCGFGWHRVVLHPHVSKSC